MLSENWFYLSTVECFLFWCIKTIATTAANLISGSIKNLNVIFLEKYLTYLEFGTMTLKKTSHEADGMHPS